nr:LRR receptor-like serine/threonine-protein kinase FLS2 [Setaria viridis]
MELYRCSALQYLDLSWNHLGRELPAYTGSRLGVNLTTLALSGNRFNGTILGTIPASLSSLQNLQNLKMDDNKLIGIVPAKLNKLMRLQTLWLAYNPFAAGELLASFKNLTNMTLGSAVQAHRREPDTRQRQVAGPFPDAGGGLTSLTYLDVSSNNITSVFPTALYRCSALQFNGTILASLSSLCSLQNLMMDDNKLIGTVLAELGKQMRLQTLWLAYNPFDVGELPASFKNLTTMTSL